MNIPSRIAISNLAVALRSASQLPRRAAQKLRSAMSTLDSVRCKDLETRGFVHVPRFLSASELEACRADYASQPIDANNRNYAMSTASRQALQPVTERLHDVLALVSAGTDLTVDLILGGTYFATKRGISFSWHQDHESFFIYQNHYDYLNFYIPIVKP